MKIKKPMKRRSLNYNAMIDHRCLPKKKVNKNLPKKKDNKKCYSHLEWTKTDKRV